MQGVRRKAGIPEKAVVVTILLTGGHQKTIKLAPSDPSLARLLEVIARKDDPILRRTLFNLASDDGDGSLVFAASDVVALSAQPAISIDLERQNPEVIFPRVVRDAYLPERKVEELLRFVQKRAAGFRRSKVTSNDPAARRSLVLYEPAKISEMFRERIKRDLPSVLEQLRIPSFQIDEIECQVTAHNGGHFFRKHNDAGDAGTSARIVTFVYYFFREPRRFEGGSLRFYKGILEDGVFRAGGFEADFEPASNTMLFFPSACFHEVLPIKSRRGKFGDGRFTVNGWVRKVL